MTLTFYQGRDNVIQVTLTDNAVPVVLATVTKAALVMEARTLDSVAHPLWVIKLANVIELKLGLSDLALGAYAAKLVVFTAAAPDGLVYDDGVVVEMKAG